MAECNKIDSLPSLVNGPYNMARLEKDKKVIYLLFDVHVYRTECGEYPNINIDNYLDTFLSHIHTKNDIKYDFFLEYGIEDIKAEQKFYDKNKYTHKSTGIYEYNYLIKMTKFFAKNFEMDNETVLVFKKYHQNRIHTIDIRMYSSIMKNMSYLYNDGHHIYNNTVYNVLNMIGKYDFKSVIDELKMIKDLFTKNDIKYVKTSLITDNTLDTQVLENLIYKIRFKYNNDEIKIKNNYIIKNILLPNIDKMIDDIENFKKNYDFSTKYIDIFAELGRDINDKIGVLIMDLYMLRRFLDKKYITNCIVYTGGIHSVNYLYLLIKFFDFKITHIDKNKENVNFLDLMNNIKDNNNFENIRYISDISNILSKDTDSKFVQCINMNNFPKYFT